MRFRDDNRAVTVQVGAILLFATIVIALATYQATVVPSQNADVEYKHSQTVQNQLADVRNAILRSAASGTTQPVSVTLGTQYPSRAFLMNPPPATGTLRTGEYEDDRIRVGNVAATNEETNDFFDAAASGWNASTAYLEYAPNYHEYDDAPNVVYGETLLYNHYVRANTTIPLTDQLLVDGNTVTLVALNGSVSTTQAGSVSVSPRGLSAPYERVQVTNDTAGPVTVTVPTLLSADAVAERTDIGSQSAVRDVEPAGDGRVRVVLEPGTYTLRTAKVGVGGGATDPGPAYVTTADSRAVRTNETFTVSVRDRFNNPVTDQRVTVSVNDSSVVAGDASKPTTEDGDATFTYTGSGADVAVSILGGGSPELSVTFDGRERSAGGGGSGDGAYNLVWDTDTIDDQSGVSYYAGNDTVVVDADVAASPIDMTARALSHGGAPLSGVFVDYASGSTAVADFQPSEDNTGDDGRSTVPMTYATGETTVHASSVADSDAVGVKVLQNGVYYRYYEGSYGGGGEYMPDFDGQTPVADGVVDTFDIGPRERNNNFGFNYTAYLDVPASGTYTFYTTSDDGSRLFVDDGLVVDNAGNHGTNEESGTVTLSEGRHNITVTYYDNTGSQALTASWEGPGIGKEEIPTTALTPRVPPGTGGGGGDTPSDSQMGLVPGSGDTFWGGNARVSFDVENAGSDPVDIEAVTLESVSAPQVEELSEIQTGSYAEGQHEVYVAASVEGVLEMDGTPYYEDSGTPLPFDQEEPMTEEATVNGGETATVYLSAFRNSGGNTVNMEGETVEITLHYGDGTSETYTVEVP